MSNLRKFEHILNEGISQEDLADTLCHRIEMRYPDIYKKYDYDAMYNAVDDVASFHAGAEELGSSDINMMIRQVFKRLEESEGLAEGYGELDNLKAKFDERIKSIIARAKAEGRPLTDREKKAISILKGEQQGVAEGLKQNLAVAGAIAGTYGGITALHNATPHASVNGVGHYYATFSPPRHAIKTVDDKGNPVYTWKTQTKRGTMNLYRPADKVDQIKEQSVAEDQLDELKCWDGYKRVPGTKAGDPGSCEKINELSTEKLGQYKKAAGADARAADQAGKFERGNKRFRGINKATKKQFDNETKPKKESAIMKGIQNETLGTPYPGTYEQEYGPYKRKGQERTMKLTTEGKKNVRR